MKYRIVSNIGAPQKYFQLQKAFLIGMEKIMQWPKGTLIGAAPSTCIGTEKDSQWSCRLKLSMAGSEDEWKLLCVVRGYHVYKYVWDPSHNHRWMSFHGMLSSVGQTPCYRTTRCFCFMVHWHRIDLTFVGSSPSGGTCGATWTFSLFVFLRLAIAFKWALFLGLPIGLLTVFSLSVDLKEAVT